jgi:hypothetical protein
MKQLIRDVLDDMSTGQINLESPAAREMIANTIMAAIKTNNGRKGWVLDLSTLDGESKLDTPIYEKSDEQKARESWVCEICGKNTYDIEWDYIGSGTNHLGCEIRLEQDENYRKKNWSQQKHEEKVFDEYAEDIDEQAFAQGRGNSRKPTATGLYEDPGDGSLQLVTDEEKEQLWIDKLAEEVVTDNDTNYIYESPDRGETVYRRKIGSDERELVKDWKTISGQSKAK